MSCRPSPDSRLPAPELGFATAWALTGAVLADRDHEPSRTHTPDWVSVRILALASTLLLSQPPDHPGILPTLQAASQVETGNEDTGQAVAAVRMLTEHLDDFDAPRSPGQRLTTLAGLPLLVVSAEMQCAAWTNRLRLLRQELGAGGLDDYLRAGPVWPGAVAVAYDHPYRAFACQTQTC